MKGIKAILAVCLVLLGFGGAYATDDTDAARAAVRRVTTGTTTASRKKTPTPTEPGIKSGISRQTNISNKAPQNTRQRTTATRSGTSVSTVSRTASSRNHVPESVSARSTSTNVTSRAVAAGTSATKSAYAPQRSATITRSATRGIPSEIRQNRESAQRASIGRSGTTPLQTLELRNTIMNSNNQECRDVYYKCMDEFCANKDSQLKRCACSSRLNEFDTVKKQLATAEEKMLDFSQRLLTVSMNAEDAAALNVATEGELAFNQKDQSDSQNILNEISKKLNKTFEDESFDRNLTAISLSLNEDAAFDNVDSLMGASTTLKTGTELYAAALPVCREMAQEVCTEDQLSIAESGYQMQIEQDCNTVKKSYQSQADQARNKVRENSALLDISRLNVYQDRNSDDILTCKKKMLEMLTNQSVCGPNLVKCLDTTGQYIDPSTGEAFLTVNLANLNYLITRPSANQTWVGMPGNEKFVSFLNSKKQYLEPATEHCQDISDYVWQDFIEDALSQIKLAQDAKLEEVRQSCTTLTTQCMSNTAKTLEEFDARALSTFGVIADVTVNAMCANVKTACTALLQATDGDTDWIGGMTEIATDKTYDTVIKTCREVGRACIIQVCKSISGNFGLCENIETSVNRKSIINRTACWQEVVDCVADAGAESINNIMDQLVKRNTITATPDETYGEIPAYSFYKSLYYTDDGIYDYPNIKNSGNHSDYANRCITDGDSWQETADGEKELVPGNKKENCVYDICIESEKCDGLEDKSLTCKTCRIAEKIWGNCEVVPSTVLGELAHNKIKKPINDSDSTLLYWFALNTGTDQMADSCRDTSCGPGYKMDPENGLCYPASMFTADGGRCSITAFNTPESDESNCCTSDNFKDSWGNCCMDRNHKIKIQNYDNSIDHDYINAIQDTAETNNELKLCLPATVQSAQLAMTFTGNQDTGPYQDNSQYLLICLDGTLKASSGETIKCEGGQYLVVNNKTGVYYVPTNPDSVTQYYHRNSGQQTCTLIYDEEEQKWEWQSSDDKATCDGTLPSNEPENVPGNKAYKISWQ